MSEIEEPTFLGSYYKKQKIPVIAPSWEQEELVTKLTAGVSGGGRGTGERREGE